MVADHGNSTNGRAETMTELVGFMIEEARQSTIVRSYDRHKESSWRMNAIWSQALSQLERRLSISQQSSPLYSRR